MSQPPPTPTPDSVGRLVRSLLAGDGGEARDPTCGPPPGKAAPSPGGWAHATCCASPGPRRLPAATPRTAAARPGAPAPRGTGAGERRARRMGARPVLHARHPAARRLRRGAATSPPSARRTWRAAVRTAGGARPPGRGPRGAAGRARDRCGRCGRPRSARPDGSPAEDFDPARFDQLAESAADQLAAQPGPGHLVHHGLGGEHLVISADGRVRGVLGWSGAVVGDPAEDIARLAARRRRPRRRPGRHPRRLRRPPLPARPVAGPLRHRRAPRRRPAGPRRRRPPAPGGPAAPRLGADPAGAGDRPAGRPRRQPLAGARPEGFTGSPCPARHRAASPHQPGTSRTRARLRRALHRTGRREPSGEPFRSRHQPYAAERPERGRGRPRLRSGVAPYRGLPPRGPGDGPRGSLLSSTTHDSPGTFSTPSVAPGA